MVRHNPAYDVCISSGGTYRHTCDLAFFPVARYGRLGSGFPEFEHYGFLIFVLQGILDDAGVDDTGFRG
jgi:hypothetical protein